MKLARRVQHWICIVIFFSPVYLIGNESKGRVAEKNTAWVKIQTDNGTLQLIPLADNAIRVRFGMDLPATTPSLVLVKEGTVPKYEVSETEKAVTLTTSKMKVVLDRETGALSYQDGNGHRVLSERPGQRQLKPSSSQGEATHVAEVHFDSPLGERLFGSGQFQDGYLDIRGLPRRMTQVNTQISLPFFLSNRGYGLLWHNYGLTEINRADRKVELLREDLRGMATHVSVTTAEGGILEERHKGMASGTFTVDRNGRYAFFLDVGQKMARRWRVEVDGKAVIDIANLWLPPTVSWHAELVRGKHRVKVWGEERDAPQLFFRPSADETVFNSPVADAVDYVVFVGSPAEVLADYTKLSGRAPLFPAWAYGYIHCRERFHSQGELLSVAAEFRKRQLPVDTMVQDWQYWGRYGWNAMKFDEKDYPDPLGMIQDLHRMNMHLMLSVWSKVDPASEIGKQFSDKGLLIPGTTWVDFFDPEAAGFYWKNIRDKLLPLGIDAWWQDATEPENDDLEGRRTHAGAGELVRNVYPLFVEKTVYEGLRKDDPGRRAFILSRSAFAGSQRYGVATWSGDIGNDWDTLKRQIPAGLNTAAAGIPYWTTDCGGFFRPGADQYTDADYHERFLRWLQYSVFCPLMRVHGYQTDTEFWRYGKDVEGQARRWLDLRYRLFPYIYSQAARVTFEGAALMRPLVMDFAQDTVALDQRYEFMFGPAFLVSPVLQSDPGTLATYLPAAKGGWVDFWSGSGVPGGRHIKVRAPLEQIPLHVRAGSIVPLGSLAQYTDPKSSDALELRVYGGQDGQFLLYQDEGDGYGYEKGAYSSIPIIWNEKARTLTLGARQGVFPGLEKERTFNVVWVKPGHGVGIYATADPDRSIRYAGERIDIKL